MAEATAPKLKRFEFDVSHGDAGSVPDTYEYEQGEWVKHEDAEDALASHTLTTVAKLLRYWAARGVPLSVDHMDTMLASAEGYDPKADDLSTACCPVCEEMECDSDCPLAEVRGTQ
jgi:hypothetical protein